jgi:hypothetical protein
MRRGAVACTLLVLIAALGPAESHAGIDRAPASVRSAIADLRIPGSLRLETARWAASEVDSGNIRTLLRELSTYPDGSPRTRQYLRDEATDEALVYLEDKLGTYLTAPGDTVWRQPFMASWREGDQTFQKEVYNCIALHKGTSGGGYYLLCGHYDTIASRTEGWDWTTDPAPGADDNGTGVVCILEAARVLGALTFDFDIRFVAFTGEEYGLLGSEHYVEEAVAAGDTILGVFNIDMIGYDPEDLFRAIVLANDRSEWIADWVLETEDSLDVGVNATKVDIPGHLVLRSDHAYFLREGYPAVSCWENIEGDSSEFNPHYHTVEDVIDYVSIPLTSRIASMFTGTLALLAETGAVSDFEVPESGVIIRPSTVEVGASASVQAVLRNLGPATSGPVSFTATLMEGPAGGSLREVLTQPVSLDLAAGEWKYVTLSWVPGAGSVGEREVRVRVEADSPGLDDDPTNNEGIRRLVVQATEDMAPAVFDVYAYPNPVRHLSDLTIHYQLSRGADVNIHIYTLEGQEIASFSQSHDPWTTPEGTLAGGNDVRWDGFESRPPDLAPGLYLYSVEVPDGASGEPVLGKFAVLK